MISKCEIKMLNAIRNHWPEYLIEAWGLGTFMVSACVFGVLLFHPDSYLAGYGVIFRNVLMGVAMGMTAMAIFKSPWGKRSGAHINPVVTLTFLRLGKISRPDAVMYVAAQFVGGMSGVLLSWLILEERLEAREVNFVATVPGVYGVLAAFAGELTIAFVMMSVVLVTSNHRILYKYTPIFAGLLVAIYIPVVSPISGMSMNPARTFSSAVAGNTWNAVWIYFIAPSIAMLGAAEVYVRAKGSKAVLCAKFDHSGKSRCIFNCRFDDIGIYQRGNEFREVKAAENIEVRNDRHDVDAVARLS